MHRSPFTPYAVAALLILLRGCTVSPMYAQQTTPPTTVTLLGAPAPGPVSSVSLTGTASGVNLYYYWVIPVYPIGNGPANGPVQISNVAALSASNTITVNWSPAPGATSYVVLRRTTPTLPSGTCTQCSIGAPTAPTVTLTDTGATGSDYTLSTAGGAQYTLSINNRDSTAPYIGAALGTASYLLPQMPTSPTAGNCVQFGTAPGTITDSGAACGAGGGGAPSGPAGGALTGTYPNPTLAGGIVSGRVPYGDAAAGVLTSNAGMTAQNSASTRSINLSSPSGVYSLTVGASNSGNFITSFGVNGLLFSIDTGPGQFDYGTNANEFRLPAAGGFQFEDGSTGLTGFSATSAFSLELGSARTLAWSATTTSTAAKDTGVARNAAGVLEVNNGTAGQYRDVTYRKAQVRTDSEPACDATTRGTIVFVAGGAGVADTYRICTKDAADAYAYRALY